MTYYSELFAAFEKKRIRYLVVGGVAVVLHGFLRATADLDLIIALDPDNVGKFLGLMKELGYKPRVPVSIDDFASLDRRKEWMEQKGMRVFSLIHPKFLTHLLDVFVDEPIPFDEAFARRARIHAGDTEVSVASIGDLIILKEKAGRPQDQEDIRVLQKLLNKKSHA